jgi:hypothetical protein
MHIQAATKDGVIPMIHRAVYPPRNSDRPGRIPALLFFALSTAVILAVILFVAPARAAVADGASADTKLDDVL